MVKRYKRRYRSRSRRKSRKRRRRSAMKTKITKIRRLGYPDAMFRKMLYELEFTPTLAATYQNTFNLNDIDDIDGLGGQPQFYTQLEPIFKHFRVRAAHVKYVVVNNNQEVLDIVRYPSTDLTFVTTDHDILAKRPYSQRKYLNGASGANNVKVFNKTMTMTQILGERMPSINYRGTMGGPGPSNLIKERIHIETQSGGNMDVTLRVRIVFYVHLFDRKTDP